MVGKTRGPARAQARPESAGHHRGTTKSAQWYLHYTALGTLPTRLPSRAGVSMLDGVREEQGTMRSTCTHFTGPLHYRENEEGSNDYSVTPAQ